MDRSVFISYSHDDGDAVRRDAELLRAGGVRVFIDVRDIAYGERWRDVLRDSLLRCERVLVFWSAAARVSEWVDREWRFALELGKKIVPTLLDTTPLPTELAQFQAVRRFDAPPRRRRHRGAPFAAAALVAASIGGGAGWWLLAARSPAPQMPGPLPTASAPAPPPTSLPLPLPPGPAASPATGPSPGASTPAPQPAPAPAFGVAVPGWIGGVLALAVLALWWARKRARRLRPTAAPAAPAPSRPDPAAAQAAPAAVRPAPAGTTLEAEARRFVEAVFSA